MGELIETLARDRLIGIQGVRALAAYLVVLFHIHKQEFQMSPKEEGGAEILAGTPFANGWAGVDLFFVISGFIMVYATSRLPSSIWSSLDFIFARASRIYPVWWAACALTALSYIATLGVPWDAERIASANTNPAAHLVTSALLIPSAALPMLEVGWTLIHEIHFYAVFAVLILVPRRWMPLALILWGAIVLVGHFSGLSRAYARNYTTLVFHPLSLEFIVGALAGWFYVHKVRILPKACLALGLIGMFTVLTFSTTSMPDFPRSGRVILMILPCTLIVYGAACVRFSEDNILSNAAKALGDWSLSIYLTHIFVLKGMLVAVSVLTSKLTFLSGLSPGAPGLSDNICYLVFSLVAVTLVGSVFYACVERPTLKALRKLRRKSSP